MLKSVLPVFSSKHLSSLIFRSLIHFEFIFVYGVECSNFISLICNCLVFPVPIIERDCLFVIVYSCLLCHRLGDHRCVGLISGLSIPIC